MSRLQTTPKTSIAVNIFKHIEHPDILDVLRSRGLQKKSSTSSLQSLCSVQPTSVKDLRSTSTDSEQFIKKEEKCDSDSDDDSVLACNKPKQLNSVASLPEETLRRRHQLYATDIEDSNDVLFAIAPTIRAIYDGDEYEKFMERLDARIKNHDRDIERMCNFHYQGFIDSIRELLQVRTKAQKLKTEVLLTNDELQDSAKKVIQKADELVKNRKIQYNISCAIESLNLCQPVLEMYFKLMYQMKEKRYYPALKILEQLEHTYLPRVSRYRFAQTMKSTIPVHREKIKEASKSDLNDFLENVRRISPMIGEKAMKHESEQSNVDIDFKWKSKKRKAPPPPNPFTGEVEKLPDDFNFDDGDDLSAQDMIDFSPVYRCLHIHTVLVCIKDDNIHHISQMIISLSFLIKLKEFMPIILVLINLTYFNSIELLINKFSNSI